MAIPGFPAYQIRKSDHLPYTKKRHEIKSAVAVLDVTYSPNGRWLEVQANEYVTSLKGNDRRNVIAMTLNADDARTLRDWLNAIVVD